MKIHHKIVLHFNAKSGKKNEWTVMHYLGYIKSCKILLGQWSQSCYSKNGEMWFPSENALGEN